MGLKNTGDPKEIQKLQDEGYKIIAQNPSGALLYKKDITETPEQPKVSEKKEVKVKVKGKGKKK